MLPITDKEFETLRDFVLNNYGIDLSKKRMLIQGRLTAYINQKGIDNFTDYIALVMNDKTGAETQMLLNRLTTNLTFFMREKEHFQFLTQTVLPELDAGVARGRQLRIWSAGCSSGEEPYTLAMTLLDYFGMNHKNRITILASDISQQVLSLAQAGVYPVEALKDVPPNWIHKYFNKISDKDYQVKPEVKALITFKTFNLMDSFRFSKPFDIIFCRNVMIYFEKKRKEELIQKYFTWTIPGGYFCISHSENIGQGESGFRMVKPSIFKRDA